jgi:3-dehydroquinate synthase
MPSFGISTPQGNYSAVVERGLLESAAQYLPAGKAKVFVVTSEDVWQFVGPRLTQGLGGREFARIVLPGGEEYKRLAPLEQAAEDMVRLGGDRSSIVIAVGGGIITDMGGFLAAIFMRGIPVIQIPTTLLAQVDAAVGGKTGTNLVSGKNLIGSFHQPLAVLIDPSVLDTLPEREYRAGLYEVIKHGIIRSPSLFDLFEKRRDDVLSCQPDAVDQMIVESVRIKAEVVSNDERESSLRSMIDDGVRDRMLRCVDAYGPIPSVAGIPAANLHKRLSADKKTVQNRVHFVLPTRVGEVVVVNDVAPEQSLAAIERALQTA